MDINEENDASLGPNEKSKKINQRSEILTLNIMVVVTEYCLNEIVINGYKTYSTTCLSRTWI